MCGLNGIFAYRAAAEAPTRAELIATRERMAVRGPDGAGEWWSDDKRCALGFRRLAIQDLLDRASQPMVSEGGDYVIVFNGEIYNFPELRAELQGAGRRFRTTSDTEVVLQLYATEGPAMVHRLRGMYAFAIWDLAKRGLFLARDPYGIKPLYYADEGGVFRFASQVKALLAGGQVSRDPAPAGVVGFHLFGSLPEPHTLYRDIRALPAGHTQWVDASGAQPPRRFFSLAEALATPPEAADERELGAKVRSAVLDSIRAHLVADVEVGVFLSAGVDSGAMLSLMRDAGQQQVRAITLVYDEFEGRPEDEGPLAAETARALGAQHVLRRLGRREFQDDLPAILEAMDQPTIDGVNTWFVSKAAHEAGLKVALSGLGGDELFGGYRLFDDIPRSVRLWGAPSRLGLGEAFRTFAEVSGLTRALNPKVACQLKYGGTYPGEYFLRRGLFMPWELKDLIDGDVLAQGLSELDPVRHIAEGMAPAPNAGFAKVAALDATFYMRNQLLRDTDWASMAHSLEVRVPLVDSTLLAALAPVVRRFAKGVGKRLLAKSPQRPLPRAVVERPKTGFGTPIDAWLREEPDLTDWRRVEQLAPRRTPWARRWAYQVAAALPERANWRRRETILVFRIGSLGDTIVALPCFHRIAAAFRDARRTLVTDTPTSAKVSPVESVLGGSGLIDDTIYFRPPPRSPRELGALARDIQRTGARTLVYVGDRSLARTLRDMVFFRSIGIRKMIGLPLAADLRVLRREPGGNACEREAERLARCIRPLGPIDVTDPRAWDLRILPQERAAAAAALAPLQGRDFIAINLGGKVQVKDWGDNNWSALFELMADDFQQLALVFFGSADEADRSSRLAALWPGATLNLCGHLSPRQSGAAMERACLFVGHDSGPMHLAAAVGVTCVAMFGGYNAPKRWHPVGDQHRIIHNMRGVRAITPAEVYEALAERLSHLAGPVRADLEAAAI